MAVAYMNERIPVKRLRRILKLIGMGLGVLLSPVSGAFAGLTGSDEIALSVRVNTGPPGPVADLAVVSSLGGQVDVSWTAIDENEVFPTGHGVESYIIRRATYSVDSLLGNTTAWWDSAETLMTFGPGLAPGNMETVVAGGLDFGKTYYFAVKSLDQLFTSSIDLKAATPGQQAYALVVGTTPIPQNLAAVSGDTQVLLSWTDLTPFEKSLNFVYYRLERSTDSVTFAAITTTTAASYMDPGLTNGWTYIYRVIAVYENPPDPALESVPSATAGATPKASLIPPAIVSGISGQLSADGQFFTINWSAVATNLDGTPITDLATYRVLKFTGPFASTTAVFDVSQTSFTDTVNGQNLYYLIRAVDTDGNESPDSVFINSSADPVVTVICDDGQTSLSVPGEIGRELSKENNPTGSDLVIVPVHLSAEETGNVLKSYNFEVRRADDNQPVTSFAFSKPLVNITFGFRTGAGIQTLAQGNKKPTIYWYNGAQFISLGGHLDFQAGTASILSSTPGRYQLRILSDAIDTVITEGSPYPRTITPNGDGINDRVFFFFEATDAVKEGKIYDLKGAFVAGMTPGPVRDSSLIWDGKDDRGNVVSRGIYLYKVSLEDKNYAGTVVVAR